MTLLRQGCRSSVRSDGSSAQPTAVGFADKRPRINHALASILRERRNGRGCHSMGLSLLLAVVGLVLVTAGAWLAVRSAANFAERLGWSEAFVGATIVAFGTSAPELVVSLIAATQGSEGVALGNVVGSNIANVFLVLGLAALIMPITVDRGIFRRDVPVLYVATGALVVMAVGGLIGRIEGAVLFGGLIAFLVIAYRAQEIPGQQSPEEALELEHLEDELIPGLPTWLEAVLTGVGVAILAGGAQLFVTGATDIAERAGVSEFAIGATLVATGTSLPEVATSAVAAYRGLSDMAVANVVGSNIFNLLGVIGVASLAAPIPVDQPLFQFEFPMVVFAALLLIPLTRLRTPFHLGRFEGSLLFVGYFMFTGLTLARG
ncbi:MAG: calcium/sodium antiporter [Dehalococcoidia bacterium]|nr:calcium/sodium antiporter [Dehalococcoidia bacterium]